MIVDIDKEKLSNTDLTKMAININSLTFRTLVSGIYNNKFSSVIREISTNARDSHISANNFNPFNITLQCDSEDQCYSISIKDYGTGLSTEEVKKYLCTLNSSSKRDSNSQIGYLGIGSKSPFAITDAYSYISHKNGEKTVLNLYQYENQTPHFDVNSESYEPGAELNSVECIIPLIETVHVKDAIASIINQLALFDIKPLVTIIKDDEDLVQQFSPETIFNTIIEYEDFYKIIYKESVYYDKFSFNGLSNQISIGTILYKGLNAHENYRINISDAADPYKYVLKFNFGELSFNEGRELVVNTTENLNKILEKTLKLYNKIGQNRIEDINRDYTIFNSYNIYNRSNPCPIPSPYCFTTSLKNLVIDQELIDILDLLSTSKYSINPSTQNTGHYNHSTSFMSRINNANSMVKYYKYLILGDNFYNHFQFKLYESVNGFISSLVYTLFRNYYHRNIHLIFNPSVVRIKKVIFFATNNIRQHYSNINTNSELDSETLIILAKTTSKFSNDNAVNLLRLIGTFENLNIEYKLLNSKDFRSEYKYLFDIFKKEISPRPIVETTERSNLTTEGFEKGRKLQITYYDTTLKIESNKTLSQTLKDLQKIYNKYYNSKIFIIPQDMVDNDTDRDILLKEGALGSCLIFEYENVENFSDIVDFFVTIYENKDVCNLYFCLLKSYENDIDPYLQNKNFYISNYKTYLEFVKYYELLEEDTMYGDRSFLNLYRFEFTTDKLNLFLSELLKLNSFLPTYVGPRRYVDFKAIKLIIDYYIKNEIKDYLQDKIKDIVIDYKLEQALQTFKENQQED